MVTRVLANPLYTLLYSAGMAVLGLHISHGFWSLFQTLGINHPRYNGLIRILSYLVCGLVITVFLVIIVLLISRSGYLA
jgi:succinate dehydrogenase / fumarate reductase cytochrome b subunit